MDIIEVSDSDEETQTSGSPVLTISLLPSSSSSSSSASSTSSLDDETISISSSLESELRNMLPTTKDTVMTYSDPKLPKEPVVSLVYLEHMPYFSHIKNGTISMKEIEKSNYTTINIKSKKPKISPVIELKEASGSPINILSDSSDCEEVAISQPLKRTPEIKYKLLKELKSKCRSVSVLLEKMPMSVLLRYSSAMVPSEQNGCQSGKWGGEQSGKLGGEDNVNRDWEYSVKRSGEHGVKLGGEHSVNRDGEHSVERIGEHSVKRSGEYSVKRSEEQSVKLDGEHSVNRDGKHYVKRSGEHSVKRSEEQSVKLGGEHSVNRDGERCVKRADEQSGNLGGEHSVKRGDERSGKLGGQRSVVRCYGRSGKRVRLPERGGGPLRRRRRGLTAHVAPYEPPPPPPPPPTPPPPLPPPASSDVLPIRCATEKIENLPEVDEITTSSDALSTNPVENVPEEDDNITEQFSGSGMVRVVRVTAYDDDELADTATVTAQVQSQPAENTDNGTPTTEVLTHSKKSDPGYSGTYEKFLEDYFAQRDFMDAQSAAHCGRKPLRGRRLGSGLDKPIPWLAKYAPTTNYTVEDKRLNDNIIYVPASNTRQAVINPPYVVQNSSNGNSSSNYLANKTPNASIGKRDISVSRYRMTLSPLPQRSSGPLTLIEQMPQNTLQSLPNANLITTSESNSDISFQQGVQLPVAGLSTPVYVFTPMNVVGMNGVVNVPVVINQNQLNTVPVVNNQNHLNTVPLVNNQNQLNTIPVVNNQNHLNTVPVVNTSNLMVIPQMNVTYPSLSTVQSLAPVVNVGSPSLSAPNWPKILPHSQGMPLITDVRSLSVSNEKTGTNLDAPANKVIVVGKEPEVDNDSQKTEFYRTFEMSRELPAIPQDGPLVTEGCRVRRAARLLRDLRRRTVPALVLLMLDLQRPLAALRAEWVMLSGRPGEPRNTVFFAHSAGRRHCRVVWDQGDRDDDDEDDDHDPPLPCHYAPIESMPGLAIKVLPDGLDRLYEEPPEFISESESDDEMEYPGYFNSLLSKSSSDVLKLSNSEMNRIGSTSDVSSGDSKSNDDEKSGGDKLHGVSAQEAGSQQCRIKVKSFAKMPKEPRRRLFERPVGDPALDMIVSFGKLYKRMNNNNAIYARVLTVVPFGCQPHEPLYAWGPRHRALRHVRRYGETTEK